MLRAFIVSKLYYLKVSTDKKTPRQILSGGSGKASKAEQKLAFSEVSGELQQAIEEGMPLVELLKEFKFLNKNNTMLIALEVKFSNKRGLQWLDKKIQRILAKSNLNLEAFLKANYFNSEIVLREDVELVFQVSSNILFN